ncbi:MAG TPA: STAS domain-containing protein [Xanthomonadaceae bacterium]|nr:STAS domain-containing protein [Xanthomonadaceae bacterium]
MALDVKRERIGEVEILVPVGRLDTESAGDLELAIHECLNAGVTRFLLDFSGVGYISSAGLSAVLMLAKAIDGKGELKLCSLNANVRQVFDMAGFSKMLDIRASRNEALATEIADQGRALRQAALAILAPTPLAKPSRIDPRIAEAARLLGALKPRGPSRAPTPAPVAGGGGQATLVSRAVKVSKGSGGSGEGGWLARFLARFTRGANR